MPHQPPAAPTPSRVRYGVLAFACSLSMVTYLDRVAVASAAGDIVAALGLTSVADIKWAFTAFALSYALFEVPTGWMGDTFGPRKSLLRIVLWWSVFTLLTAAVGLKLGPVTAGLGFLVVVRFLFGIGEAGAYPNIGRALHNWLPLDERGLGQGLVWFSGKFMAGITPFLWTVLVVGTGLTPPLVGWRGAFGIFATLGVLWCLLFGRWFRDTPAGHPAVNAAELALIRAHADGAGSGGHSHSGVPWRAMLTNRSFLALCLMYAAQGYGWWFNITYLPQFLEHHYGMPNSSLLGALYKGGPLWMGAIGSLLGGLITDRVVRRTGNLRLGRRCCGFAGHAICVACFLACPFAPSAFWFFLAVSLAAFFTDLSVPSAWATCQDIGGRSSAVVGAFMNMAAGISGAIAGAVTGSVLEWSVARRAVELGVVAADLTAEQTTAAMLRGYHWNFVTFAVLYGVAFLCWFWIDPTKRIAS